MGEASDGRNARLRRDAGEEEARLRPSPDGGGLLLGGAVRGRENVVSSVFFFLFLWLINEVRDFTDFRFGKEGFFGLFG